MNPTRAEIVDNADPLGLGRVKIRSVDMGEQWQAWAPVLRQGGGAPAPAYEWGDHVLVVFEGGDKDSPVVLGAVAERGAAAAEHAPAPPGAGPALDELPLAPGTRHEIESIVARDGQGSLVLFSGPPGTGKTMAAAAVARRLGLDTVRIDLSAVASKYIGETEKALDAAFAAAEAGGAMLLLDEADALLGNRSEVKDSHDRHANVAIDYLLQRLEGFSGLAILESNERDTIEATLGGRLDRQISFPLPRRDRSASGKP